MANWLTVRALAEMLGVDERNVRAGITRCLQGKPYRGRILHVKVRPGRGGRGGRTYLVRRDSVPNAWLPQPEPQPALPVPTKPVPSTGLVLSDNIAVAKYIATHRPPTPQPAEKWRVMLCNAVIDLLEDGCTETLAIDRVALTAYYPDGKRAGRPLGRETLRRWVHAFLARGLIGLRRKPRADARRDRVIITGALDSLFREAGADDDAIRAAKEQIDKHIKSLWAQGAPGRTRVRELNTPRVIALLQAAGCTRDMHEVMPALMLTDAYVLQFRKWFDLFMYRTDSNALASDYTPRIRRTIAHLLPMQVVAGDVAHMDIYLTRDDGTRATPKIIAWLDIATKRLCYSVHLLDAGRAIAQQHVAQSFMEMCLDPRFGVPRSIYIDNGSEYALFDDPVILDLFHAADSVFVPCKTKETKGVRRARPHNPQAKFIEGSFAELQRLLSMLPGYIGGNRMKTKSANQGKPPKPYPGTVDDFRKHVADLLALYHCSPKKGQLGGRSPNEVLQAKIDEGWRPTTIEPTLLDVLFARETVCTVSRGVIRLDNEQWTCDELYRFNKGKVRVRVPLVGNKQLLPVFDAASEGPDSFIGFAAPITPFALEDAAGAREQQRANALTREGFAHLAADTESVDMPSLASAHADVHHVPVVPPPGAVISVSSELGRAADAAKHVLPLDTVEARTAAERTRERQRAEKIAAMRRLNAGKQAV